jgi:hypothetical protein
MLSFPEPNPNLHGRVWEWPSLPYALQWIVEKVKPEPPDRQTHPPYLRLPEEERKRAETRLFHALIDGQLQLFGRPGGAYRFGHAPDIVWTDDGVGLLPIPIDVVKTVGFNGISWGLSSMHGEDLDDINREKYFPDEYPDLWGDLRIRWDDLFRLTAGRGAQEAPAAPVAESRDVDVDNAERPQPSPASRQASEQCILRTLRAIYDECEVVNGKGWGPSYRNAGKEASKRLAAKGYYASAGNCGEVARCEEFKSRRLKVGHRRKK